MHDAEQCCRNFPFPRRLLAASFVISWNSSSAFTLLSLRHKQTGWSCLSLCQSHACFYSIWAQDVCHVYTVGNTAIHYIRPSIEGEGGGRHGQSASRGGSPLIDGGRMDEKNWGCTVQWLWDVHVQRQGSSNLRPQPPCITVTSGSVHTCLNIITSMSKQLRRPPHAHAQ